MAIPGRFFNNWIFPTSHLPLTPHTTTATLPPMAVLPWDGWYHCMGNTYGTWLRGDQRGWRSRHHREHVEGDYRRPPAAETYQEQLAQSQTTMKRAPVVLDKQKRAIVCEALVTKLLRDDVEVARAVVAATHFHIVARFPNWERPGEQRPGMAIPGRSRHSPIPGLTTHHIARRGAAMLDPAPRHFLGRAKKHSSHTLRERGLAVPGGVWGVRTQIVPLDCEHHFGFLVDKYLPEHAATQEALLWKP